MNKRKMLEILENIKTKIEQDNLDNYNLDNRVEELEKIKNELNKIDNRISYLSEFVSDETNYRNNFFALNDEALRYDIEKNLINCNIELDNNKKNISELNEDIAKANKTIGSSSLEITNLEEELLINGQLLRSLGEEPNIEEENIIKEEISNARNRIDYLNNNIERLYDLIKSKNEDLKLENNKTQNIVKKVENAKDELNKFDNNIVNTPMINEANRKADIEELETLKYEKQQLKNRDRMLSLDYSMEFQKIYNDLENDKITINEASKAVESVVNSIPEGYFIEDIETKENELKNNRKKQVEVQNRIDRLNNKLKDDSQYTVSAFVAERNNDILKSCETKIKQYYADKNHLIKQELKSKDDLSGYEKMLQITNSNIMKKGEELRSFGNDLSKEDELSIQESIKLLRREKQQTQNEINEKKSEIIDNSNEITKIDYKLDKIEKILNNYKSTLNDRNTIDRSQKRLDETKLAAAVATLSALKNREKFINNTVFEVVDKALGIDEKYNSTGAKETTLNIDTDNKSDVEFINGKIKELGIPAKIDLNEVVKETNNDLEKTNEVEPIPFPKEMNSVDENSEQSLVNSTNQKFEEVVVPEVKLDENEPNLENLNPITDDLMIENEQIDNAEIKEEEDLVEEEKTHSSNRIACKFKDAKKELVTKARSKEFKEKIYKFAKKAAALVAILAVTIGGSKLCKKLMEKIEDPSKYNDIAIEKLIEDDKNKYFHEKNLVDDSIVLEEDNNIEEEIVEEKVEEETKDYIYENNYKTDYVAPNYNFVPNNNGNDNSYDITVPEIKEEENTVVEPDTNIEAPDAVIEDTVVENDNTNENTDITVTPENDIIVEDVVENESNQEIKDEVTFDNLNDIETPEIKNEEETKEEDIIIEDAVIESETKNDIKEEVTFDNLDNLTTENNNQTETNTSKEETEDLIENNIPSVSEDNFEETKEEDIIIEDAEDVVIKPEEQVFDNVDVGIYPGESITIESENKETFKHTNTSEEKDEITFDAEEIEREHELTKEELQQLREEFANSTGNEVITEENLKSK